ncbi:MAG: N-acetyltransferase family protein [Actinomycetes bacterium]
MDLTWLDPENLDPRDVAGAVAVLEAARAVDAPHWLPTTTSSFTNGLRHGWDGEPALAAVVRDDRRRVAGVLQVSFPTRDNTHLGLLDICVDPRARRQGLGRALYDAGVARTRAEGRTMVLADSWDEPGSVAFAKAMGLERASDAVQRHQDLSGLDRARLDAEHAAALEHAREYELLSLTGATPDDMVAAIVELTAAINDAPTDDLDVEDEVFSPERLRAFEQTQVVFGRRIYRVVARHVPTGALAGHTIIAIDEEFPWFALQYDTSVVRAHRGHRLGLLLKTAMLRRLLTEEPQVRVVSTWNAASNDHMIGVNEVLGYQVVANAIAWQRHL